MSKGTPLDSSLKISHGAVLDEADTTECVENSSGKPSASSLNTTISTASILTKPSFPVTQPSFQDLATIELKASPDTCRFKSLAESLVGIRICAQISACDLKLATPETLREIAIHAINVQINWKDGTTTNLEEQGPALLARLFTNGDDAISEVAEVTDPQKSPFNRPVARAA